MNPAAGAELLALATAIGREVDGRAAEIDATRHLPRDIGDALARAGLLRMLTPREFGGHELDVASFFAVVEALSAANASVGWCTFIANNACLLAAYLPERAAHELFAPPLTKAAGVYAPRGRALREGDGWRVSGRWAWGSATHDADVIAAGCLIDGDAGGAVLSVIFERAQVEVLDNWAGHGLRGTGSGEFEVHDVWVSAERSALLAGGPRIDTPLYRFPVFGLLAASIAAVSSGLARRACDEFIALAAAKTPQASARTLAERATVQEALARCVAAQRAARAGLMLAIDELWAACSDDSAAALIARKSELRRDLRLAATHLAHTSAATVAQLFTLAGGSSAFETSPLSRCLRDVQVTTQHLMVGVSTWELCGRLLLAQPTRIDML